MDISVFGLGYVGVVAAACLADEGHKVIGVDPNREKVRLVEEGSTPIIEPGLAELIGAGVSAGRLGATTDAASAVHATSVSLVCVGTPSEPSGALDLRYVRAVCEEIGGILANKDSYHLVVLRSTIVPGTMLGMVIPTLEKASGKRAGKDFGVCFNPEFLREGSAISDYRDPPKTVVGASDNHAASLLHEIYASVPGPKFTTSIATAEMVKYVDNAWHALKVSFANEVGSLCKTLEIDSHEVMDIFVQDTHLNLSPYYLKPGFAFGGSCLPKDVRALNHVAKRRDLTLPVLASILPSNEQHVQRGLDMVLAHGKRRIGILGFSFKANTDDLRESPVVELIERLIGKGYDLRLFDRNVSMARLMGANREYILNHIPHISRLMVDSAEAVMEHAEVVVIGNNDPAFATAVAAAGPDHTIIDLVRIANTGSDRENYHGICW